MGKQNALISERRNNNCLYVCKIEAISYIMQSGWDDSLAQGKPNKAALYPNVLIHKNMDGKKHKLLVLLSTYYNKFTLVMVT